MRTLDISLLHYSAPPVVGGVESVIGHHARLMRAAGHGVRILAARGEPPGEGIAFVRIPLADSKHADILAVKKELDEGRVPPAFEELVRRLAEEIRSAAAGSDLLIAHNVCSLNKNLPLTAALARLSAERGFPRLILWQHDLAWSSMRDQQHLHEGHPWDLLRTPWPAAAYATISADRRDEISRLTGIPSGEIRVIPNGIDIRAFFKLETESAEVLSALDLTRVEPLLFLPSRVTRRKNLELALRTMPHLLGSFPKARLLITGPLGAHNPANRKYFESLTALQAELGLVGAVHFLAERFPGGISDAVVSDFYALADAVLLPSWEEGYGIPLIEAALSHKPVFCSDLPPLRALGLEDATYFDPATEPARVADLLIRRLREDPLARFAMRVRTEYSWDRIYQDRIAPFLEEAARNHSQGSL